ncbi:hypothetical protein [Paraburkholderia silvatlantica]
MPSAAVPGGFNRMLGACHDRTIDALERLANVADLPPPFTT